MRARNHWFLACLMGVALAVPALAQSGGSVTQYPACPDPPPKLSQAEFEAAKASYKVGVEAFELGDYKKALENIKDAFRRDCSKVALLQQLARIYEAMGEKPEAIHALEVYLQRNPKAEDADRIQTRIQNLKAQLPQSTATATTTSTATATTTATATATVVPTATATTTEQPSGGHSVAPWIVFGTGAAAAIAGGILIGMGAGDWSHSRENCATNPNGTLACTPQNTTADGQSRDTLNSRGALFVNVGIAVGGVGLAAMIGGLIWHFVEPTGPKKTALTPMFGPGFAGVLLGSTF